MDQPDVARQVLPWLQMQAAAFHRGEFPLWDPLAWAGQPLLAQILPGTAFPLNWILFALPMPGGHIQLYAVQVSFVVTHCLAALFGYWLCRDLQCSRAASMFGGAAFSLSGEVGWLGWPQLLNGAIWIPLIALFTFRSLRTKRPWANAAIAGTFLGVSLLGTHHQISLFAGLAMTAVWLAWGAGLIPQPDLSLPARKPSAQWMRAGLAAGVFLGSAILAAAFQVLPTLEYGVRSLRWVGAQNPVGWNQPVPYLVHESLSMTPLQILGLVLPSIGGDGVFTGLTIVVLALVGIGRGFSRPETRILAALAVGGLLFALGGSTVFQGALYWLLPLLDKARTPAMAIIITQFALAVLAARGVDQIREHPPGRRWTVPLILAGALVWGALAVFAPLRPEASREYHQWAVLGVVAISLAALFRGAQLLSGRVLPTLLFGLMLFELSTVIGQNYYHREHPAGYLAELDANRDLVDFLRRQNDLVRLELDGNALPVNMGDWNNLPVFQEYLPSLTTNIARTDADPRLFALTHYAGKEPSRPGQQLLFRGESGVAIFRNPKASAAAWVVHQTRQAPERELPGRVQTGDPQKEVVLADLPPALENCDAGEQVRIVEKTSNGIKLDAHLACRGMVILSETFYPGWSAWVDGQPARIWEADGVLRGVVADGGDHRIEMRFRPVSVYLGAGLSAFGFLMAAGLGLKVRRISRLAPDSASG
jgi:hypothetical protein